MQIAGECVGATGTAPAVLVGAGVPAGLDIIDPAKRGEAGHYRKLRRRRSTQDARRRQMLFLCAIISEDP